MRKYASILLLILILLVSSNVCIAEWKQRECYKDFEIETTDNGIYIVSYLGNETNTLSVPEYISDKPVIGLRSMNDYGTEAASIIVSDGSSLRVASEEEIEFILNRPFIFAVFSETDIPLFIGIYNTA